MGIREFIKTLDPNKVYYAHFKDTDTWASIYQNRLIFADGSGNTMDKNIMFFDDNTTIYDAEKAHCYQYCNENNQIYPDPNPMSELKNGTFIRDDRNLLGVVFDNKIVYQNGTHCTDAEGCKKHIVAIYQAYCFNQCVDYNIIWRKNND